MRNSWIAQTPCAKQSCAKAGCRYIAKFCVKWLLRIIAHNCAKCDIKFVYLRLKPCEINEWRGCLLYWSILYYRHLHWIPKLVQIRLLQNLGSAIHTSFIQCRICHPHLKHTHTSFKVKTNKVLQYKVLFFPIQDVPGIIHCLISRGKLFFS